MARASLAVCLSLLLAGVAFIAPGAGGSAKLAGQPWHASANRVGERSASGHPVGCRGPRNGRRARCERARAERKCLESDGSRPSIRICSAVIVSRLAADNARGRNNGTPGSTLARRFLIDQLRPISEGLNRSAQGDAAYRQVFPDGVNLVSIIRGTDLARQVVLIGAHYDHLGTGTEDCLNQTASDKICNGATDNAAGVAAVLGIGRALARSQSRPRRSIVLALWDAEEDGLLGSRHYTEHPIVPLSRTVAYANFDIQGANLLPSLRRTTIAVAAETGGNRLQGIVRSAAEDGPLDTVMLSSVFGQYRSDYASFLDAQVPSVFFSDSTGPCYHTAADESNVVDFGKLAAEIDTALALARRLASTSGPPTFASGLPPATFEDLLELADVVDRGLADIARFSAEDQATGQSVRSDLQRLISEGRDAFGPEDQATLLGDASRLVTILTHGKCDGFLRPRSAPWWIEPLS